MSLLPLVKLLDGRHDELRADGVLIGCAPDCRHCKWEAALAEARKQVVNHFDDGPDTDWLEQNIIGEADRGEK